MTKHMRSSRIECTSSSFSYAKTHIHLLIASKYITTWACEDKSSICRLNCNVARYLYAIPFDLGNIYCEIHSMNIQLDCLIHCNILHFILVILSVTTKLTLHINSVWFCILAKGNKFTWMHSNFGLPCMVFYSHYRSR